MTTDKTLRMKIIDSFDVDESELQQGVITNVKTIDSYAPYYYSIFTCEQQDGTYPPTHGSPTSTLEKAEEFLRNSPDLEDRSIKYDPEVAICLELDGEEQLFHFKSGFNTVNCWKPTKVIVQTLHQQVGLNQVTEKNPVPVIYDQTNIYVQSDEEIVSVSRRLHNGEPEKCTFPQEDEPTEFKDDCSQLANYLDYLKEEHTNPTEWVETSIESILLPDTGELPILVNTPLGPTKFTLVEHQYNTMSPEKLAKKMGIDKFSELSDKSVYIRPQYKKFHDDITSPKTTICEYTAVADASELWELSVVNPNSDVNTMHRSMHLSAYSMKLNVKNSFLGKAVQSVRRRIGQ